MQGHSDGVLSVAFSPCGSTIASGSWDDSIKLWDAVRGVLTHTLQGHSYAVYSVAFSPCGSTLASGSDDHSVKLWDAGTGVLKTTMEGHTDVVYSVAFSPCGSTIASGSGDSSIKLWDAVTGELRATLNGHADHVTSVVFQPPTIDMVATALHRSQPAYDTDYDTLNVAVSGFLLGTISHHPHHEVVQMARAINHHREQVDNSDARDTKTDTKQPYTKPNISDQKGEEDNKGDGGIERKRKGQPNHQPNEAYLNVRKQRCARCRARQSRDGQCKPR